MNRSRKIVRGHAVEPESLLLAKQLRREMTLAEQRLWKALRRNAADGFHFRRQQVINGYIVDFYCNTAKLAIEVDGGVHGEQTSYDESRDGVLARNGVHVVRISNEAIYDIEAVIEFIREKIRNLTPDPLPLTRKGEPRILGTLPWKEECRGHPAAVFRYIMCARQIAATVNFLALRRAQ